MAWLDGAWFSPVATGEAFAALVRDATAGLTHPGATPFDARLSAEQAELALSLGLLDAKDASVQLFGGVPNATGFLDGLEQEQQRDLRADALQLEEQMTPYTLFKSVQRTQLLVANAPQQQLVLARHDDSNRATRSQATRIDASESRELSDAGIASDSDDAGHETPGRARAASSRKRNTPGTQRSGSSGGRRASGSTKKAAKRVRRSTTPAPTATAEELAAALAEAYEMAAVAPGAEAEDDPYRFSEKQDKALKHLVEKYRLKSVTGENIVSPTGKSRNGIPWTDINRAILAGECPELRRRICNAASHVLSKRWWILCPADCPNRERIMH